METIDLELFLHEMEKHMLPGTGLRWKDFGNANFVGTILDPSASSGRYIRTLAVVLKRDSDGAESAIEISALKEEGDSRGVILLNKRLILDAFNASVRELADPTSINLCGTPTEETISMSGKEL